ncbi:catalase A [Sporothrix eucalyptigena]|uniref:Catalase A n=1 Tax=Sporothrix eucalyptigena TaxID=1812306 RepID=A0ABP0CYQ8_9PEZI
MSPSYTLAEGAPQALNTSSVQLRNGHGGGHVLLQDTQLIETLAHFNRERVPERVVHAKAAGAYGEFEATHDVSDLTDASFLSEIGKKTKVMLRVSTVGPERGSADTIRDVHGWAMKLYTDEGNLDWVFNNTAVFFVRDPIKFPSVNRAHKRHPRTNMPDADMFWDFHVGNPEGTHQLLHLFSDRGTPASIRHMNAYSGHTYTFTKADGSFRYIKVHIKTKQGVKNLSADEAVRLAGEDPDHLVRDLFDAVEAKNFPQWDIFVQVLEPEQAEKYHINIFDMTKVWPHAEVPLRPIGRLTINTNPRNYFADIEQAAFSPSNMVPGWGPSADPMLQARMFAYPDAARYRLGINYQQLPTNKALAPVYVPTQRDGFMNFSDNYGDDPNYVNSMLRPVTFKTSVVQAATTLSGKHQQWVGTMAANFTTEVTPDDFVQATALWHVLGREPGHQARLVENLAGSISGITVPALLTEVYKCFAQVDPQLAFKIQASVEAKKNKSNGTNGTTHIVRETSQYK